MKKYLFIVFVFVFVASIAFTSANLYISGNPSNADMYQGTSLKQSFTLNNDNSTPVTDIFCSASGLPSGIIISFQGCPSNLLLNTSTLVNYTLTANSTATLGSFNVIIKANGTNGSGITEASFNLNLKVDKTYCENGNKGGKLRITINEPDSGDDFYAGENISLDIKVKNTYDEELDIVLNAEIYDLTDKNQVIETKLKKTIADNTEEHYELVLKVPYNIDPSHEFRIYVKAYEDRNEDEQCNQKYVDIDLKKESHKIVIERLEVPAQVACGSIFNVDTKIANAGTKNEKVKMYFKSSVMNIDTSSSPTLLTLDAGKTRTESFLLTMPLNLTEGNYTLQFIVKYYKSGDDYNYEETESKKINVKGNCVAPTIKDVSLNIEQLSSAFSDQDFQLKIMLTNTGNIKTKYILSAQDYDSWATLKNINPTSLEINPGASMYAYLTLHVNENVIGTNTIKVKVAFNNQSEEQIVTINIAKPTKPATKWEQLGFEIKRNLLWFIMNIILLIAIILIIVWLVKRGKGKTRKNKYESKSSKATRKRR